MGGILNRDLQAAADVEHLYKLNYFSEEFIVYATAYVEADHIKYRFNEQSKPIYQFCQDAVNRNMISLPVEQYVKMIKVETGLREVERMKFFNEITEQIECDYPIEIFQLQKKYQVAFSNDAAYEIMLKWKKELLPCFSLEPIQLFEGAVKMAVGSKHLSKASFQSFMRWIEARKSQIVNKISDEKHKNKYFSGFLYKEGEEWKSFSNAVEDVVWNRRYQYQKEGIFCTPILQKTYYIENQSARRNAQWKEDFDEVLTMQMDTRYIKKIEQLRNLPSVLDKNYFQKTMELFHNENKSKAIDVLRYYALLCNITL